MTSTRGQRRFEEPRILLDCAFRERRRRAIALLWLAGRATAARERSAKRLPHPSKRRRATTSGTTERLLANRFGHTLEPAFGFEEQVTVWNRRHPGRLTLRGFEPDLYRIKP